MKYFSNDIPLRLASAIHQFGELKLGNFHCIALGEQRLGDKLHTAALGERLQFLNAGHAFAFRYVVRQALRNIATTRGVEQEVHDLRHGNVRCGATDKAKGVKLGRGNKKDGKRNADEKRWGMSRAALEKRILRLYKGGAGIGMVKIGKTLGIGTGLVQRVLAEQPRPFDVDVVEPYAYQ